jgi:hypothetical protein
LVVLIVALNPAPVLTGFGLTATVIVGFGFVISYTASTVACMVPFCARNWHVVFPSAAASATKGVLVGPTGMGPVPA